MAGDRSRFDVCHSILEETSMAPYPHHRKRLVRDLNGLWDFAYLGDDVDLDGIDPSAITFDERMPVPSAFDAYPAYAGKRGTCAYRTEVSVPSGMSVRLRLHGAGMWNRIVVDGSVVGDVSLPYSGFWVDVPPSAAPRREIVIINDNRFDSQRVPLQAHYFDFYAYGGIFRQVECHAYERYCIERAVITATPREATASVTFHGDVPDGVELTVSVDDGPAFTVGAAVEKGACEFSFDTTGMAPWSPESPSLHTIHISTPVDDIIERFGVRTLAAVGAEILLNGAPLQLRGFCRHEGHPQFGPALPLQQLVQDVQILKELGANFVRGSHYPQDQRFLDLCDENGILVFEESLAWQAREEHFNSPAFCDAQEEQTRLMVRNSVNHPSVILWGFFNECASHTEASRPIYSRLVDCIREEDPTRLVTFASNHPKNDLHYDLVDVVCVNTYPGWYEQIENRALEDCVAPMLESVIESVEERNGGGKPLIISEIGAGALYGWHDPLEGHWSEAFQAEIVDKALAAILSNPRFSGVSIWQFCDCRTYTGTPRAVGRPRSFNNKGILDEYRRPKRAYEVVEKWFSSNG
jgi:beta-glucuronidase